MRQVGSVPLSLHRQRVFLSRVVPVFSLNQCSHDCKNFLNLGASVVVQQNKPTLGMPASCIRAPIQALAAPVPVQLLASALQRQQKMAPKCWGHCHPCCRLGSSISLLAGPAPTTAAICGVKQQIEDVSLLLPLSVMPPFK